MHHNIEPHYLVNLKDFIFNPTIILSLIINMAVVVYAVFISLVVTRKIKLNQLPRIMINSGITATIMSFLACAAILFAWVLAIGEIPQMFAGKLLTLSTSVIETLFRNVSPETFLFMRKITVLIVLNIVLLLIGMLVDGGAVLFIVVPVLIPIGQEIGMNPVHFGVMVVSNLVIGLVTPPVGVTLFIASGIGKVSITEMIPYVLRFLFFMLFVQLLITYVPPITTFLPSLIK